ncbi:MAG: hypothetical protein M5U12_37540 [Verrucomicrobia bacterium]|nr:hypothetical protein [Verrucomicrobiota bacterium]
MANSAAGKNAQAVAQERVSAALERGYETLLAEHARWWTAFWNRSRVFIPEPHLLRHYYLVRYFYGAASRQGAPPMPLQGVWTADAGGLPPWKGDYHNDLNTQMTYLAYRTSGDFDAGLCFLDYLWDRLPVFRHFARDFYHAPGAAVPGVMSLAGQALGGWGQYSLSPTMGAWNAHLFYLHWRHTADTTFLRERAYPFCREIGVCLRALLQPNARGVLVLPLSSSPEIFDNTRRAFLEPNSNYDLASLKMLFLALADMAATLGEARPAADWARLAADLGDWHLAPDGTLLLDATTPLPASHRHLSNLMPLHPSTSSPPTAANATTRSSPPASAIGTASAPARGAATASPGWPASAPASAMPPPPSTTSTLTPAPSSSATVSTPTAIKPAPGSATSPTVPSPSRATSSPWTPSTKCSSKAGTPCPRPPPLSLNLWCGLPACTLPGS